MKKIASLFLALVMALSLAVPAFAQNGTVKVDGSIQMPTINVVLPTVASMVLNPYGMDVTLVKGGTPVQDQVVSTLMQVKNLSDINIKVEAKVLGTVGKGDVTFATASVAGDTSAKKAYIYGVFEVGDATDTFDGSESATVTLSTTDTAVTGFADTDVAGNTNTLAASTDKKNPAAGGVLNFQFFGDTSDRTDWNDKDTLGATVTFKFIPVGNAGGGTPTPAGNVAADDATLSLAGTTSTTVTASLTNAGTDTVASVVWSIDASSTGTATIGSGTTATETVSVTAAGSVVVKAVITTTEGNTYTATTTITVTA